MMDVTYKLLQESPYIITLTPYTYISTKENKVTQKKISRSLNVNQCLVLAVAF